MIPGSFGKLFRNFGDLVKLAKDEDFQRFFANQKVQTLMKNEEFKRAVEEKDFLKLAANPEFTELLKDPEVGLALEGMKGKFHKSA